MDLEAYLLANLGTAMARLEEQGWKTQENPFSLVLLAASNQKALVIMKRRAMRANRGLAPILLAYFLAGWKAGSKNRDKITPPRHKVPILAQELRMEIDDANDSVILLRKNGETIISFSRRNSLKGKKLARHLFELAVIGLAKGQETATNS